MLSIKARRSASSCFPRWGCDDECFRPLGGRSALHKNPFSATRLRWSWQRCCSNAMERIPVGEKGTRLFAPARVMRHARHFCNYYAIDRLVLADANIFE